jgi:ADP-ribose pyrophosphatase YjhB (NUDIX family)
MRMLSRPLIHFCKSCGSAVTYRLPDDGDTKERAVCMACKTVHYENPLNIVGTIPYLEKNGKLYVLLCLRNIEPRKGKWTLPAGFMELGETAVQGAARETEEEAGAKIEMQGLFTVLSVPAVGQVHLHYRAKLLSEVYNPGYETTEVRLFSEDELPWDEMAFRTIKTTLKHFFEDAKTGIFKVHERDLI